MRRSILISPLLYVLVYLVFSKRGKITVGVCPLHRKKRKRAMLAGWLTALAGLGSVFAAAVVPNNMVAVPVIIGFVLMLAGLIGGAFGSRILAPQRIDKHFIWLNKVCAGLSPDLSRFEPSLNRHAISSRGSGSSRRVQGTRGRPSFKFPFQLVNALSQRIVVWTQLQGVTKRFECVPSTIQMKLTLGQTLYGSNVKWVPFQNTLTVLCTLGELALEEINNGALVIGLGEVGSVGNQPRDQSLRFFELLAADQMPHFLESPIIFRGVGTKPDGPKRVFGHAIVRRGRRRSMHAPGKRLLCSKLPRIPSDSTAARRADTSGEPARIRPSVPSL